MSITVKIYQYDGDHRCLDKVLPAATAELSGVFRESVDVLRPDFLVERSAVTGNYVHIGDPINKYYYITDINQERTGLQRLFLHEDVLMSYKNRILQLPAVVGRNGVWSDPDLYDPDLQRLQKTQSYMAPVGNAFNYSADYILITVG